jgi:photosystem II stability/assembly factor-like uncharacterized protein
MKHVSFLLLMLITGLILFSTGCKPDEEENDPADLSTPIIAENTRVLDAQTREKISDIDTSNYTFTLSEHSHLSSDLKAGDIIVDDTSSLAPYGYMRRITNINDSKGDVVIQTEQAKLTEAVRQGTINFNSGTVNKSDIQRIKLAEGVELSQDKFTVFDFNYNKTIQTGNGSLEISGNTSLSMDFYFYMSWGFDFWSMDVYLARFGTGVNINQKASIITIAENGLTFDEEIPIASFYFSPYVVWVGFVPVVFVPKVSLYIDANGEITGVITASASEEYVGKIGVKYTDDDGWENVNQNSITTNFTPPNLDLEANFETHLTAEMSLLLYGIVGPFVNMSGCTEIGSTLYNSGNWKLFYNVGSMVSAGMTVDILGTDLYSDRYCLFVDTIYQLEDQPLSNGINIMNPTDGSYYNIGYNINIETSVSGQAPDEVVFYINDNEVFTDTEAPYEYLWDTNDEIAGDYSIKVEEYINDQLVDSDNISLTLQASSWTAIDLSNLGLDASTNITDVMFTSNFKGWLTYRDVGLGVVLNTTDGGNTWNEVYSNIMPLDRIVMHNDNDGHILSIADVMETFDGASSMAPLEYNDGYNLVGTFTHDVITEIGYNLNNELIALGEPEANDYYNYFYRVDLEWNEPVGEPYQIPHLYEYQTVEMAYAGNTILLYNILDNDDMSNQFYMLSTDGGQTFNDYQFNDVPTTLNLNGAYVLDEYSAWIVGGTNATGAVVLISTDGGISWSKQQFADIPYFSSVHFVNSDEGYATVGRWSDTEEAKLYYTSDGGYTWEPIQEVSSTQAMNKVYFLGSDKGFVVGYGNEIFKFSSY